MTLKVKDFGDILTSRPAGREAALAALAYLLPKGSTVEISLDFDGVQVMTPSWLSEFVQTLKEKGISNVVFQPSENPTVTSSVELIRDEVD